MSAFCRTFRSALGRTRTCDLLIRSQTRSKTGGDREGHRERHGVVVPLWYERVAAPKLEDERADRDQQALLGHFVVRNDVQQAL